MIEISLQESGLPESGSVFRRTAARGVIEKDGQLLLIHTNAGDYKFPGGGVEPGESLTQTLSREMLEETGRTVLGEPALWAVVHERRKGRTADILEMDSYYFLCQVAEEQAPLQLDDYEAKEHFTPVWASLPEALHANRELAALGGYNPWLRREILVMEKLQHKAYKK